VYGPVTGRVVMWSAAGRFFATRPLIARALSRVGNVLMPIVLIGIDALILIQGGGFGPGRRPASPANAARGRWAVDSGRGTTNPSLLR
jgi:hypothetical protein